jgi:hypothetical protein
MIKSHPMPEEATTVVGAQPDSETAGYEPPQIVWEEVFETTVFGLSCAKHPGQPRCSAGPIFR